MGLNFAIMSGDAEVEVMDFRDEPQWSYGGFNRFRQKLYEEIGGLDLQHGFATHFLEYKDNPIIPLLDHSDCDGILTKEQCILVAPQLEEFVMRWPVEDYDRIIGLRLVKMMELCEQGNYLQFC